MHTSSRFVRYFHGQESSVERPARTLDTMSTTRENAMTAQVTEEIAELDINDIKVVSAEVIDRALSTIDSALAQMVKRELVSADEVSDLLLDVRNLLTTAVRG
jgi:hypothetical protein